MWQRLSVFGLRVAPATSAALVVAMFLATAAPASAAVVISGTRVVYLAVKREVTIDVHNAGETLYRVRA